MTIETNPNEAISNFIPAANENEMENFLSITEKDIDSQFDSFAQEGEKILKNPNYEGIDRKGIEAQIVEAGELKVGAIDELESITKH